MSSKDESAPSPALLAGLPIVGTGSTGLGGAINQDLASVSSSSFDLFPNER